MEKVKAMVDGKNVTTDWIESVFDSDSFAYDVRTIVGFINRCVVEAKWDENKVTWTISRELGYGKPLDALFILDERLRKFEDEEGGVFSKLDMSNIPSFQIIQRFYFKES